MEEEIDLREYILVLINNWYWIAGFSLLAALAALAFTAFQTRVYEARANVIILASRTTISLEPRIQTEVEQLEARSYQQTLINLVTSSDVAADVLLQVEDLLEPEQRTVLSLLRKVEAENIGDVIVIAVTDRDPEKAAQIANVWATSFERYVNRLLNEGTVLVSEVETQLVQATEEYRVAQINWETFLQENTISVLERELNIKQERAEALKNSELGLLARELDIIREENNILRNEDVELERLPVQFYNLRLNNQRELLDHKYGELRQIEVWLEDAVTLRDQLESPGDSYGARLGDTLALVFLRSTVLASSASSPVRIDLDPATLPDESVALSDANDLIDILEARRERTQVEIDDLEADLLATEVDITFNDDPAEIDSLVESRDKDLLLQVSAERWYPRWEELETAITTLDQDINDLQAEIEAQRAQRRELLNVRDLTWENFTAVNRKFAEVRLDAQITDSQVRVASSAVVPQNPTGPRRLYVIAAGGAIGLFLSTFAVFAWEYWRSGDLAARKEEAGAEAGT